MASLTDAKAAARKAALGRRAVAHAASGPQAGHLTAVLANYRGLPLAGYLPMRTEIDPLPAMAEAAAHGPVGVPVIHGAGLPLSFRTWTPDGAIVPGTFGTAVPADGTAMVPRILIVPLVAFDARGGRLGYGGGFYDRTLEALRRTGPVLAIGYAFAAQEAAALPLEPTDQPLDMIVTESGVCDRWR
ncbi:5-formyltetrahydrofolate cyclo-ligase [Loktanella atrilutea]|uniref:5-formyltetrahydrofolate cyclo-ligase n=1 Tax=Loktanella atrilutea TaxID=366533 RepID=A0A1M5BM63_LOKAT|nr:5-formyltetrahydrofolate cyclo-ligase [Loktanella atrilutea]SHF43317.1 5-formyltetrahydrofolate cyclo-ligase [Loktanella atrilutea]